MCRNVSDVNVSNVSIYRTVIVIPDNVVIEIKSDHVLIMGKLGKLIHKLHKSIDAKLSQLNHFSIYLKNYNVHGKSLIGTTKSLIEGMIIGVQFGFVKKLQLVGIGYRVSIDTHHNILNLSVGLSHPVYYELPNGISAQCLNQTEIVLTGIDKQLVGQVAANLRSIRPPEPFKGKGIRYLNEKIRKKETTKK